MQRRPCHLRGVDAMSPDPREPITLPAAFWHRSDVTATPRTETRSQYLHRAFLLQSLVELRSWNDAETIARSLRPLANEVESDRTELLLHQISSTVRSDPTVPAPLLQETRQLELVLSSRQKTP
jgi:hypothetical protein